MTLRTRLIQDAPVRGEVEPNAREILRRLEEARADDVDLLVFPELYLTGYHVDEERFRELRPRVAEAIDDIADAAGDTAVVLGSPEYDGDDLYNSAFVLEDEGVAGSYRKTHLYDAESFIFEPGDTIEPVATTRGALGVEICYDLEFPEVARTLAVEGADLIVTVSANMVPYESYQETYLRARAMENAVPHVLCNRIGTEADDTFFGNSGIVDATGTSLRTAPHGGPATPTADVALEGNEDETLSYLDDRRPEQY